MQANPMSTAINYNIDTLLSWAAIDHEVRYLKTRINV